MMPEPGLPPMDKLTAMTAFYFIGKAYTGLLDTCPEASDDPELPRRMWGWYWDQAGRRARLQGRAELVPDDLPTEKETLDRFLAAYGGV